MCTCCAKLLTSQGMQEVNFWTLLGAEFFIQVNEDDEGSSQKNGRLQYVVGVFDEKWKRQWLCHAVHNDAATCLDVTFAFRVTYLLK